MVNPVTRWPEFCQLYNQPTEYACQQIFYSCWLAIYPQPKKIGTENGGEFKKEFTEVCNNMGIKQKTLYPWNPQSNAMFEINHQVLADRL